MEDISKAVFALSKLKKINDKRSDHFATAAEKVKNAFLKTVLMNYSFLAQQFNVEIDRWLQVYGAPIESKTENLTKAAWEKVKSLLMLKSEQHVLADCEALEEEAFKVYQTARELSFLPHAALKDVERHTRDIDKIRTNIKSMRENSNASQLLVA